MIASEGADEDTGNDPFDLQVAPKSEEGSQQNRHFAFEEGAEYDGGVACLLEKLFEHGYDRVR
ncbi:hypothetical protein GCM10009304_22860 [Pseudomonas matsuisoli]|uniref:Uncharacterized protein n=1 Tax=Pseudomonas matsuisoli TaxID=1515666 RepID=A0A917PWG2_9PSED|nr:hypothetical protein GCM10009304_22860 [Pseudomonas matsuisoli]